MLGSDQRLEYGVRREVGVQPYHRAAMHHDIRDLQFAQIEHAGDHIAMLAPDGAFFVMQIHRAANFFVGVDKLIAFLLPDADKAQHAPNHPLHRAHDRRQYADDQAHGLGDGESEAVCASDRQRFGQNLGEHQDENGHHDRGDGNRALAKLGLQHPCREGGGENVEEGVGQQNGADNTLAIADKEIHIAGRARTFLLQLMHACAGNGGQRGFGAGEERGHDQQKKYDSGGGG